MAGRVKIVEETTLYKGWSTLKKFVIDYTRQDGRKEKHIREIKTV